MDGQSKQFVAHQPHSGPQQQQHDNELVARDLASPPSVPDPASSPAPKTAAETGVLVDFASSEGGGEIDHDTIRRPVRIPPGFDLPHPADITDSIVERAVYTPSQHSGVVNTQHRNNPRLYPGRLPIPNLIDNEPLPEGVTVRTKVRYTRVRHPDGASNDVITWADEEILVVIMPNPLRARRTGQEG